MNLSCERRLSYKAWCLDGKHNAVCPWIEGGRCEMYCMLNVEPPKAPMMGVSSFSRLTDSETPRSESCINSWLNAQDVPLMPTFWSQTSNFCFASIGQQDPLQDQVYDRKKNQQNPDISKFFGFFKINGLCQFESRSSKKRNLASQFGSNLDETNLKASIVTMVKSLLFDLEKGTRPVLDMFRCENIRNTVEYIRVE